MSTIKKAEQKDASELDGIINREFAYKKLDKDKIIERMKRPEITVFKKEVGKELAGFVEVELIDEAALVNALSVKSMHRRRGFGRELLLHALEFLKRKGIKKARLIVKENNALAKKLYESCGFEFICMHDKQIDGAAAEIWEKRLKEKKSYLN